MDVRRVAPVAPRADQWRSGKSRISQNSILHLTPFTKTSELLDLSDIIQKINRWDAASWDRQGRHTDDELQLIIINQEILYVEWYSWCSMFN